jgi:hypothetical protein
MADQVAPMRVGDVDVLVQTIPAARSAPTSTGGAASQHVLNAFE